MTDPSPTRWRAPLRQRLVLLLASAFAVWHSAVIVLGAAPPSYLFSQVYPLFKPYVEFLHLDGRWGFFAPDPSAGRLLRYVVEDSSGQRTTHAFTETLHRADPAYLRYTTLSAAVDPELPAVMNSVAQMLCRQHAAVRPLRIAFVHAQQIRITPEQHEAGQRPLDAPLLRVTELAPIACRP